MKRFLSIMLAAAMLMSVFCFNVSAAVPTKTGGEWSVLVSDNFDSGAATYLNRVSLGTTVVTGSPDGITYPAESEDSTNKVVDLQMVGTATINETEYPFDGAQIGVGNYTGNTLATGITMPNSTVMIEFDMCGKTLTSPLHIGMRVNNGAGQAIKINPNNIEADTWYTFRIVVDRAANQDTFTVDNTTVYRKLRDGNDDFVKVEGEATAAWNNTTTLDYGIGQTPCQSIVGFAVTAHNSYIRPYISTITSTTKSTGASTGTATHTNYVPEVKDAHYQIDNVTVYAKSAETEPELSNGILKYWDMEDESEVVTECEQIKVEDTDGNGSLDWETYAVNSVMLEDSADDNHYVKFTPSAAPYAQNTDYFVKWSLDEKLPETFILSFDANNAALGSALDIEIYGDCYEEGDTTIGAIPKRMVYLRSHEGILNKWYSYKVVCSGAVPIEDKAQTVNISIDAVYRKERGSSAAYTLLTGKAWAGKAALDTDCDYGLGSTMGGNSNHSNINSVKFGDSRRSWLGYYSTAVNANTDTTNDPTNKAKAVWYLDNVMITEAAALTGDVSVADSKVTAALNLSTTAASTPILAVYDGTKLVDVDFSPVAHEGAATLTAKYDTTALLAPKAMLYVWDSLANGKPVLAEAIDVATYID